MIRLNPTSIRLRPADVKALQDELERRREAAKQPAKPASGTTHERRKDANSSRSRTVRNNQNNQNAPQPADAAVEERRRRRAGMTAQERIGYICEWGRWKDGLRSADGRNWHSRLPPRYPARWTGAVLPRTILIPCITPTPCHNSMMHTVSTSCALVPAPQPLDLSLLRGNRLAARAQLINKRRDRRADFVLGSAQARSPAPFSVRVLTLRPRPMRSMSICRFPISRLSSSTTSHPGPSEGVEGVESSSSLT